MRKVILCLMIGLHLSAAEIKVLAFAGSTRKESYNQQLIEQAVTIARQLKAQVTLINLKDYPMPIYNGDLEASEGKPAAAKKLSELMKSHDVIMIASPEYNSSVPALLKNTLDWASRGDKGGYSPDAYKGKQFAIMSASPGSKGGARALVHLRSIITAAGGSVIEPQVSIKEANKAFNAQGELINPSEKEALQAEIETLLRSILDRK